MSKYNAPLCRAVSAGAPVRRQRPAARAAPHLQVRQPGGDLHLRLGQVPDAGQHPAGPRDPRQGPGRRQQHAGRAGTRLKQGSASGSFTDWLVVWLDSSVVDWLDSSVVDWLDSSVVDWLDSSVVG